VNDLTSIQWQIVNYWQQKGSIPADISALNDSISGYIIPVDPETGKAYGYQKSGALTFKLCGDFELAADSAYGSKYATDSSAAYPMIPGSSNWSHGAGTVCFDRTIDPDMYPVRDASMGKTMY
jgi:hypothetical protein